MDQNLKRYKQIKAFFLFFVLIRAALFNCRAFFTNAGLTVAAAAVKPWAKGSEGQRSLKAKPSRCDSGDGCGGGSGGAVIGTTQTFESFHLNHRFNWRFIVHWSSKRDKTHQERRLSTGSSAGNILQGKSLNSAVAASERERKKAKGTEKEKERV